MEQMQYFKCSKSHFTYFQKEELRNISQTILSQDYSSSAFSYIGYNLSRVIISPNESLLQVDKPSRILEVQLLHFLAAVIEGPKKSRITFIAQFLFYYFTESEVQNNQGFEVLTIGNVFRLHIMMNDVEKMESLQFLLQKMLRIVPSA